VAPRLASPKKGRNINDLEWIQRTSNKMIFALMF
jgi:hypothetical protein